MSLEPLRTSRQSHVSVRMHTIIMNDILIDQIRFNRKKKRKKIKTKLKLKAENKLGYWSISPINGYFSATSVS